MFYMDGITYNNKGLTGLANLGNTCFVNSCIQVLIHLEDLNKLLDDTSIHKKINKTADSLILMEYDNIRRLMWSKNCTISPSGWIKTIHNVARHKGHMLFTDYSQNDIHEFLMFLMECFHDSLKRPVEMNVKGNIKNDQDIYAKACFIKIKTMYEKEYSEIFKIFYGIHVVNTYSIKTNELLNFVPEPYFILDLPMSNKQEPSIYDCFDTYFEGEKLEGDNAWFNEKINAKEDVKRNISFWSFPDILIVSFKRFTSSLRKDQRLVTFPLENLDIRTYATGYHKDQYIYDLCGVCNHSGNVMGGHYTAYVKNEDKEWYCFNDTHVNKIVDRSKIISTYAYCLFYKKKTFE